MPNTAPLLPISETAKSAVSGFDFASLLYDEHPNISGHATQLVKSEVIPSYRLRGLRDDWLHAGQRSGHTQRTIEQKELLTDKLLWFMQKHAFVDVGLPELQAFFDHLANGHQCPLGRFDRGHLDPRAFKPMRPVSAASYYTYIQAFWAWLLKRQLISNTPFRFLEKPRFQSDQIAPFTDEQLEALFRAASRSSCPYRNTAVLSLLLDTGIRATELCSLSLADVDFSTEERLRVRVMGKGNKTRTLPLSETASRAMWQYFKREHGLERYYKNRSASQRRTIDKNTPLIISAHRANIGQQLTRSGLKQLISDLGATARIGAVRCSPHTFRHTFAIKFLRNGADIYTLREMLGHTSFTIVQRYLAISQADTQAAHDRFSPLESLNRTR